MVGQLEQAMVLSSGGIDSSAAIAIAIDSFERVTGLFVDFGQPAADAEENAHRAIVSHFGIESRRVRYRGSPFTAGEIRGRNAFLLHVGLLEFPTDAGSIIVGIHAGTGYADCSPQFVSTMQHSFDLNTGGRIQVNAPFLHLSKGEVFQLALDRRIPIELTHSCEAGNDQCGSCDSCRDRLLLLGSTL